MAQCASILPFGRILRLMSPCLLLIELWYVTFSSCMSWQIANIWVLSILSIKQWLMLSTLISSWELLWGLSVLFACIHFWNFFYLLEYHLSFRCFTIRSWLASPCLWKYKFYALARWNFSFSTFGLASSLDLWVFVDERQQLFLIIVSLGGYLHSEI